jgi:predicted transcriptional regulator
MYGAIPNNIIFRCDPSLKAQADRVAKARDETVSQVLRRALREYVKENAELPKPKRGAK